MTLAVNKQFSTEVTYCDGVASDLPVTTEGILLLADNYG